MARGKQAKALDRRGMPEAIKENQCLGRKKRCRQCKHRYVAGDKSWYCPRCNEPRRCTLTVVEGYEVCRMHGAHAPKTSDAKYVIAKNIQHAFNRILKSPDLLNLTYEISLIGTRIDQLQARMDNIDPVYNAGEVLKATAMIRRSMSDLDWEALALSVNMLESAVDPIRVEDAIWDDLRVNFELLRRMNDTERRWITASNQMVPIAQVLELIIWFQRLMFRYITSARDRKAVADEIRSVLPPEAN